MNFIGKNAEVGHTYQKFTQEKTGFNEDKDILKNIYDLEGNNREWTAQASSTNSRVCRGGDYDLAFTGWILGPASNRRNGSPRSTYSLYSSRSTLYL